MKDYTNYEFKVNEKGNLSQLEARALKADLVQEAVEVLQAAWGYEFIHTADGMIMLIPNANEGVIPVSLDLKVKNLDYDYETARVEYEQKQAEKAAKAKTKADKVKKITK